MPKKILLASTSTLHNQGYLEYLLPTLKNHFEGCTTVLFIPFAQPSGISLDDYTSKVAEAFEAINLQVKGLHTFENKIQAIHEAEAIFTGGGNTFLLVSKLYDFDLMNVLKKVIENGIPYLGTSAGSNIAGMTMNTTNDMPIILPKSFQTLGLIPFNLNPHYLDANANSHHMGETRETRIKEFHTISDIPVLGLREGSWLEVTEDTITLRGDLSARLFRQLENPIELPCNSVIK